MNTYEIAMHEASMCCIIHMIMQVNLVVAVVVIFVVAAAVAIFNSTNLPKKKPTANEIANNMKKKVEIQTTTVKLTDRQTERMKLKCDGTQCGAQCDNEIEDETTE